MHSWLDKKYVSLMAPYLERFMWKNTNLANCRCPLCGDSETNQFKARTYIYEHQGRWVTKCHNCGVSLPFGAFLKRVSRALHDEYVLERLKERRTTEVLTTAHPAPANRPVSEFPGVFRVASQPDHQVYRFCQGRKLSVAALNRLFLTDAARTWLKPLCPEDKVGPDDKPKVTDGVPYLIQPFRLRDGSWFGAQLRRVDKKEFLTFRWAHDPLKMFGLEAWTPEQLTYVIEGPIDALFIPNSLSPCGADLLSGIRLLHDADIIPPTSKLVYVWDNEPNNSQIVRHLKTAINLHEPVVIWPRRYPHKDINDAIRAGVDVRDLLTKRTFTGLNAELEFRSWTKK